jgi:hypothetical protein
MRFWPELRVMADRVRELTGASGVAIALTTNDPGEIECGASSGPTAPELGRSILVEDSLTALCLRTGEQLRCNDAETDPRAQCAALFELGVRSLVITPIRRYNRSFGVLTVFANTPHAFTIAHSAHLRTAADRVAGIIGDNRKTAEKPLDRSMAPPPSLVAARKAVAETETEPAWSLKTRLPADQLAQTSSPPSVLHDRFLTFEALGLRRKKWRVGDVAFLGGVTLATLIAAAIWLAVASPTRANKTAYEPAAQRFAYDSAVNTASNTAAEPVSDAIVPDATAKPSSPQTPSGQAMLSLEPRRIVARQGVTIQLNIVVSHGQDVSSVPMQINYDPQVLRFVDVSEGEFFAADGQKPIVLHRDDPSSGTVKIDIQLPTGTAGISGGGTVCRLAFLAMGRGSSAISVMATARDSQNRSVDSIGSRVAVMLN